ncbi:MAG: hypothetical protein NT034_01285 [Candidatus Magasanikbacteria bacterium]|nr:hypothetical protein [Candidatus Magasanikbacteria bacterium]
MITIPLYVILFIYFAFLVIFGIFSFVNLGHIYHSGALTFVSFIFTIFIALFVIGNFILTFNLLIGTDWQQPVTVWNSAWISNTLTFNNI